MNPTGPKGGPPKMTHRTTVIADHHKSVFVCAVLDHETGETRQLTLPSRRDSLEPFFEGLAGPVRVYVEACRAWEWVSNLADDIGADFRLVNPREMPEISRSTKKSDKRDVEAMVRRFVVEGDLPRARCLTRDERALRAISRERGDIAKQRRKTMLRIHAVIDGHDLPAKKDKFVRSAWREEVEARLKDDEWLVLDVLLRQLDSANELLDLVSTRLVEIASESKHFARLKTIPGIGPILAAIIIAEIPRIDEFGGAHQLAAFIGLVPRVRSSAGKPRIGKITKSGPGDLRWALTQAVVVSARCKVQSPVAKMYHRKRFKGKPAKVAICAAANKLSRVIYAMLTNETDFKHTTA